ncbi:hypothetical protein L227DRAFT_99282 [Lentinus tigrinus ALCF2SS1-6]|uniref:Uncharacterized protein n=1 Tax=Lentinus tigrinus ALCF2SS1-6 TaxID=1328759 RepID=A0A5C2SAR5_9APHY|nr:hypothetical protein L227DRAFT_99282 [Lentinus tigrinus ALCF2SS1-6]
MEVDEGTHQLLQSSRHIMVPNVFRTMSVPRADLGLGAMPLVCGDSFEEYNTGGPSTGNYIADNIDSAPLITRSAFPTLQYLCHLWPIRAAERISLRPPYFKTDLSENMLVMFHPKDTWNYFAMSQSTVGTVWPGAKVIGELEYGVSSQVFNFDHCDTDIMMAEFFLGPNNARNTSIPCDQPP